MFVAKDLVVSSTSLGADCEDDYLQDPELWKDSLPQPYQLVDEILQEMLFTSWQLIEAHRAEREAEKSKPVIPRCSKAQVLKFLRGVTDVMPCSCFDKNSFVIFVTSEIGLSAIDLSGCASEQGEPTVIGQETMEGAQRVHSKWWRDMKKHSIVAVTMATGRLRLYTLYNMQFILMIEFSNTELEVNGKVTSSLISKQCSHLVLAIDGEDGYYTNVYGLPEELWNAELDKLQPDSSGKPSTTFTKPTLLLHIKCPLPFQPCPHTNPAASLANITARGSETILSSQFFENRRKVFVSQRRDFVNPYPPEKSNKRIPHFHFLYYDHGVKKSTPTQLTLWWEDDVNLAFYSLETRDATPIHRWPQASYLHCSEVNSDSSLLAVGLTSGRVALWNLVTYQHVGMVKGCGDVCSLLFIQSRFMTTSRPKHAVSSTFTTSDSKHALLLGCSDGSLHVTDCTMPSSLPLANSVGTMDALTTLLATPALPKLVACLQKNSTMVLRDTLTGEAICELQLPPSSSFKPHTLCFIPSGSIVTFIAAIDDEDSYLHVFQLNRVESLQHYWEKENMWEGPITQPHSGQIELLTDWLENFLATRKDATPERLLHSQQRWKQLSTEVAVISQLKKQTRQSQLVRALRRRGQVTT